MRFSRNAIMELIMAIENTVMKGECLDYGNGYSVVTGKGIEKNIEFGKFWKLNSLATSLDMNSIGHSDESGRFSKTGLIGFFNKQIAYYQSKHYFTTELDSPENKELSHLNEEQARKFGEFTVLVVLHKLLTGKEKDTSVISAMIYRPFATKAMDKGIITPTNDEFDNDQVTLYKIIGFPQSNIRLAINKCSRRTIIDIVGYDERGMWMRLGDRPDLKKEHNIQFTSWRNDIKFTHSDNTPAIDWLEDIIEKEKKRTA